MKGTTFLKLSVLIVMLISCLDCTRGNPSQILKISAVDSTNNFVHFFIDGTVTNNSKIERLNFYYLDSLAHGQGVGIAAERSKLIINAPALLMEASAKQTPFLIYPGEKINIKYAGSDSVKMYIQDNIQRTNELDFFRKLVQKTGNVYYFLPTMPYQRKVNTINNIHELEKSINNLKNIRLQFLNLYARQFSVSGKFNKIALKCIESTAILDSVLLYGNNRVLLSKQNVYKKLAIEKIPALKNIGFLPYPMYYVACLNIVSIATGAAPDVNISNNSTNFIKRFDFIAQNFEGEIKDFLLANTLNWARTNNVDISKNYLDKFNSQCTNKGYKEIINQKLNENKAHYPKGSNNLLSGDGKTVQDLSTIIAKYKGKIILLDFWASWCNPCRQEMPYTSKLKKEYAGKNIVFVAISTDSDISAWKKADREESLENNNSFLLLNSGRATFIKHYHINSIPRYLLLGKDGKIISDDAPRPSDPQLKILIKKYL